MFLCCYSQVLQRYSENRLLNVVVVGIRPGVKLRLRLGPDVWVRVKVRVWVRVKVRVWVRAEVNDSARIRVGVKIGVKDKDNQQLQGPFSFQLRTPGCDSIY